MDRNARFAQHLLGNLGQLACIDPSLGMAEFIGNSAIFPVVQSLSQVCGVFEVPASGVTNGRLDLQLCHRISV